MMWPFSCKECPKKEERVTKWFTIACESAAKFDLYLTDNNIFWHPLSNLPPTYTNLLVASKDFTYFSFLYFEDGWDYSRKINMQGNGKIWATYTNSESIGWWLNLDAIKKVEQSDTQKVEGSEEEK